MKAAKAARRDLRRDLPRDAYPRPLLQRDNWTILNGTWDFAIDPKGTLRTPAEVAFDRHIIVPFAPETPASGIGQTGYFNACWYRRTFDRPALEPGRRLWLHFGAIDYSATVWVNGQLAATHEGGYTPFSADITDLLTDQPEQTIVVLAQDDPLDVTKPRGKQDWQERPHSIWYYRTTGIWQTVWMETVSAAHIHSLRWSPDLAHSRMNLTARIDGRAAGTRLAVRLTHDGAVLADDIYQLDGDSLSRSIGLSDLGIDDARHRLQWSPSRPTLIDAELRLLSPDGAVLDEVRSYAAMRDVRTSPDGLLLNGRPYFLRLALDQGYWPESGLSAPDDDAYRRDIELLKSMGFNGVRKHQKIEDPRFLYWADRLGLLVWEEMPSAYRFSDRTVQRLTRQWIEAIERDASHPCIIAWVPLNESWGVPDLPTCPDQQSFVQAIYHLTKSLDPTRPVIGNDGWENITSDIVAIHDYAANPQILIDRYGGSRDSLADVLKRTGPHGRLMTLGAFVFGDQPVMLTEFGGIALSKEKGAWGYTRAQNARDLAALYGHLLSLVRRVPNISGFCYTQFTDTYQEANGLVYMDRTPKVPVEQIAAATRGPQTPQEKQWEAQWQAHVEAMQTQNPKPTRKR